MNWYVFKSPNFSIADIRDQFLKNGLEYYLPTENVIRKVGGETRCYEKPMIFGMIFVKAEYDRIQRFQKENTRMHLVYNHRPQYTDDPAVTSPLIIPDKQMEMFMKTVSAYNNGAVPVISPKDIDLTQGDRVAVVGGDFDGVEGILVSQQGREGGQVVISVGNLVMVSTLHISPEHLRIISYGKGKKHLYKHLDSYIPRLQSVISKTEAGRFLKQEDLMPLRVFCNRYCRIELSSVNAQAKMLVLLYRSHSILGNDDEARACKEKLDALMPKIKSEKTKAFYDSFITTDTAQQQDRPADIAEGEAPD